ncbi:MAG: ribosomal protein S18-alanine N-acetyltransferase [Promethearchaeota archaeon]
MITIRAVTQKDLHQIMQIEWESFSDPYPRHIFEFLAQTTPDLFLVAAKKERIFGYITAEINQRQGYDSGHLLSLAVRRRTRREGVGHQLITKLVDIFKERNCREVVLEVRISNNSAKSFYRKHLFQEVKRIPGYYEDGEDAIFMKRNLEESV